MLYRSLQLVDPHTGMYVWPGSMTYITACTHGIGLAQSQYYGTDIILKTSNCVEVCNHITMHVFIPMILCKMVIHAQILAIEPCKITVLTASYPGLLTPGFVTCSTSVLVLQATNTTGARRPGYEATLIIYQNVPVNLHGEIH